MTPLSIRITGADKIAMINSNDFDRSDTFFFFTKATLLDVH